MKSHINNSLEEVSKLITTHIKDILTSSDKAVENDLLNAIRYSALSEGKMLRAYLAFAFGELLDVSLESITRIATAIELIHAYSLIHDDLPIMDDAPLRRGKESCHIKFGNPTAILAGDALQALAFETLAHPCTADDPFVIIELIEKLAAASGYKGMVGGQYLDLQLTNNENTTNQEIIHMQKLKTGAIIEYSCHAPAIIAKVPHNIMKAISGFAHDIGIAYQIKDDLLDITSDENSLGKTTNNDSKKATLIDSLGKNHAELHLTTLIEQAKAHLHIFGDEAKSLHNIADYIITRDK